MLDPVMKCLLPPYRIQKKINEGSRGKRVLEILAKTEHCQKKLQISHAGLFRCIKQSSVFLLVEFAILYAKKHLFS